MKRIALENAENTVIREPTGFSETQKTQWVLKDKERERENERSKEKE